MANVNTGIYISNRLSDYSNAAVEVPKAQLQTPGRWETALQLKHRVNDVLFVLSVCSWAKMSVCRFLKQLAADSVSSRETCS